MVEVPRDAQPTLTVFERAGVPKQLRPAARRTASVIASAWPLLTASYGR